MPIAALCRRLAAASGETPDDDCPSPEEIIITTIDQILGGRVLTRQVLA